MWRRSYLLLLLIRVYFAFSPSYLHPDENFQGPEVIAGELFAYPVQQTWEWTSSHPIRSIFPLWPVYGIPMTLLRWVWPAENRGSVSPETIYYALRVVIFVLSFVLEDWAIYELVHSPRHRRQAAILVASSYVTWTYQSHTFSNSIETILVAWSLVLIERIVHEKDHSRLLSCAILAFLVVFGVFNRITFPAFILIPGLQLLPHFLSRPASLFTIAASAVFFTSLAIATDTAFYHGPNSTSSFSAFFTSLRTAPIITPWNNIRYNTQVSNLALHGLHPHHQHFLVNLPQLLGPALVLLYTSLQPVSLRSLQSALSNPRFLSALTGTAFLSIFPHQEPRFLLPCVPLLLTCVRLPTSTLGKKLFWTSWLTFNILLGTLMGIYHQGGVIPAQLQIPPQLLSDPLTNLNATSATVFWWKTYPPPTYLLGDTASKLNISTTPLMGLSQPEMITKLSSALPLCNQDPNPAAQTGPEESQHTELVYLVAPSSSSFFPATAALAPNPTSFVTETAPVPDIKNDNTTTIPPRHAGEDPTSNRLQLTLAWHYRRHINLDDIDIGGQGLWGTLQRVVGRRGLGIWRVRRVCPPIGL